MDPEAALLSLLENLSARHYRWTTPTPETQRRVLARPDRQVAVDLAGIFGWSLPFAPDVVDRDLLSLMRTGGIVVERGNLLASILRVSSLGDLLFLHSAYPTAEGDAVFFGPDTYRFARFIVAGLSDVSEPLPRLIDIGCGSGAGAIIAARAAGAIDIIMSDINPAALRLARINAVVAGIEARTVPSNILRNVEGTFDLVIANPPYLVDDEQRVYRHGGDALGAGLSLRIAREAAERLNPQAGCSSTPPAPSSTASIAFARPWCPRFSAKAARLPMKRSTPTFLARSLSGRPIEKWIGSPPLAFSPSKKALQ